MIGLLARHVVQQIRFLDQVDEWRAACRFLGADRAQLDAEFERCRQVAATLPGPNVHIIMDMLDNFRQRLAAGESV